MKAVLLGEGWVVLRGRIRSSSYRVVAPGSIVVVGRETGDSRFLRCSSRAKFALKYQLNR